MATPTKERPIGFWARLVDQLLEERLDGTLEAHRLTRRHWQTLNVLGTETTTLDDLEASLRPFLTKRSPTLDPILTSLIEGGLAEAAGGGFSLTGEGLELRQQLLDDISKDRTTLTEGIEMNEYRTTVSVLERMARNLGWNG